MRKALIGGNDLLVVGVFFDNFSLPKLPQVAAKTVDSACGCGSSNPPLRKRFVPHDP